MSEIGEETKAAHYLLLQQTELTTLSDRLYTFLGQKPKNHDKIKIAKEALRITKELLFFLRKHFPKCFHIGMEAPLGAKDWYHAHLAHDREKINLYLNQQAQEEALCNIIQSFLGCCRSPSTYFKPHSWHDFLYLKQFTRALAVIVTDQKTDPGTASRKIFRLLFYLNFNTPIFYDYCIGKISEITRSSLTLREQRRELLHLLKQCRQIPEKPGVGLDPLSPSLKESVAHYLEEELVYLEKVEHLHAEPCLKGNARAPYPFYFQVSFTASQLAFFVRLMVETGLIITKKKADLHEFIVNHVGTLKKESLSGPSLKNKSYQPTEAVVRKVKAQLHLMLQHLNRNFT